MDFNEALNFFGLDSDYTIEELKKKYYPMISNNHPDVNLDDVKNATVKSQTINQAYMVLRNAAIEKKKKQQTMNIDKLKEQFINELKETPKKYKNNKEVQELCKRYISIIKTIIDNFEFQKKIQQFRSELEIIDYKIQFINEREEFKKILLSDTKSNSTIIVNASFRYQRLLENIYDLENLIQLKEEYKEHVKKILEDEKIRRLNYRKQSFRKILNTTIEKYSDDKIKELVSYYDIKLKETETIQEIDKLEREFNTKFEKIRQQEKEVLNLKIYLESFIKRYQKKYNKLVHEDIFLSFLNILKEKNTREELEKLQKDFIDEINKIKKVEEVKWNKFLTNRDNAKRAVIYYFYNASLGASTKKIIANKELLEELLEIINSSKIEDMESVLILISELNYENPKAAKSEINLFKMIHKGKIKVKDERDIKKIPVIEEYEDVVERTSLKEERDKIKKELLKALYHYLTNKDIKDIPLSLDLLIKILELLDNMPDNELVNSYDFFSKIDFKNMKDTEEILELLKPSSRVFINLKTGDLCILRSLNNQILVTPLDYKKPYEIVDKITIGRNFISINDFFKKATAVGNGEVSEMLDRYNSRGVIYRPEKKYLYFYKNVMLEYNEPTYGARFEPYFSFRLSASRFGWSVENSNIGHYSSFDDFENREICEDKLMKQIAPLVEIAKKFEPQDSKKY